MATLPTLLPNGTPANFTTNWSVPGNGYLDIDEGIASADGNAVGDDTNSTTSVFAYYALTDMPADFGSMDSLTLTIRYRVIGSQTNNRTLRVQLLTDEASPIAVSLDQVIASNITNTTFTNQNVTIIANDVSKEIWDNAVVRLELVINRNKGGDTNGIRVDALEFNGTYSLPTFTLKVNGLAADQVSKVNGVTATSISKINNSPV